MAELLRDMLIWSTLFAVCSGLWMALPSIWRRRKQAQAKSRPAVVESV